MFLISKRNTLILFIAGFLACILLAIFILRVSWAEVNIWLAILGSVCIWMHVTQMLTFSYTIISQYRSGWIKFLSFLGWMSSLVVLLCGLFLYLYFYDIPVFKRDAQDVFLGKFIMLFIYSGIYCLFNIFIDGNIITKSQLAKGLPLLTHNIIMLK